MKMKKDCGDKVENGDYMSLTMNTGSSGQIFGENGLEDCRISIEGQVSRTPCWSPCNPSS